MRRHYRQFILLCGALLLCAMRLLAEQTAREAIHENIFLSASNFLAYMPPTEPLTKTPKGYEPFYMTHYGRHGSRWHSNDNTCNDIIKALTAAEEAGKLTATGREVLRKMNQFYPLSAKRLGDLTPLGERQHHGIGRRMTEHFPEIFKGDAYVDARSTVVVRCILSMVAECEELMAFNPKLRIHNDVSESLQYYMNQSRGGIVRQAVSNGGSAITRFTRDLVHPDRLCSVLFNDPAYVEENVNKTSLVKRLFEVAINMQSHDVDISFYDLFTEDEIFDLWRSTNISWYVNYCNSPYTDHLAPFSQENLLDNILSTADTIVGQTGFHGATLRFGHEICVLPLACLLELGNCNASVEDLSRLEETWRDYEIYPMGCNIQLIFYRPMKGKKGDILVKALLNEKEVSMPAKTDNFPYYKWSDLRLYYGKKLSEFRTKAANWTPPEPTERERSSSRQQPATGTAPATPAAAARPAA